MHGRSLVSPCSLLRDSSQPSTRSNVYVMDLSAVHGQSSPAISASVQPAMDLPSQATLHIPLKASMYVCSQSAADVLPHTIINLRTQQLNLQNMSACQMQSNGLALTGGSSFESNLQMTPIDSTGSTSKLSSFAVPGDQYIQSPVLALPSNFSSTNCIQKPNHSTTPQIIHTYPDVPKHPSYLQVPMEFEQKIYTTQNHSETAPVYIHNQSIQCCFHENQTPAMKPLTNNDVSLLATPPYSKTDSYHCPSYLKDLLNNTSRNTDQPSTVSYLCDLNDSTISLDHPSVDVTPLSSHIYDGSNNRHGHGSSNTKHIYNSSNNKHIFDRSNNMNLYDNINGSHIYNSSNNKHIFDRSNNRHLYDNINGSHIHNNSNSFSLTANYNSSNSFSLTASEFVSPPTFDHKQQATSASNIECVNNSLSLIHNSSARKKLFEPSAEASSPVPKHGCNIFEVFNNSLTGGCNSDSDCYIVSTPPTPLTSTPLLKHGEKNSKALNRVNEMKMIYTSTPLANNGTNSKPQFSKNTDNGTQILTSSSLRPEDCIDLTTDIRSEEFFGFSQLSNHPGEKQARSVQTNATQTCNMVDDNVTSMNALQDHAYMKTNTTNRTNGTDTPLVPVSTVRTNHNVRETPTNIPLVPASTVRALDCSFILPTVTGQPLIKTPHGLVNVAESEDKRFSKYFRSYNDSDSTIEYTTGYHSNSGMSTPLQSPRYVRLTTASPNNFKLATSTSQSNLKLASTVKQKGNNKKDTVQLCKPVDGANPIHQRPLLKLVDPTSVHTAVGLMPTKKPTLNNVQNNHDYTIIKSRYFVPISTEVSTSTSHGIVKPVAIPGNRSLLKNRNLVVTGMTPSCVSQLTPIGSPEIIRNNQVVIERPPFETSEISEAIDYSNKGVINCYNDSEEKLKEDIDSNDIKKVHEVAKSAVNDTDTVVNLAITMTDAEGPTSHSIVTNKSDIENMCDVSIISRSLIKLKENPFLKPGSNCSDSPLDYSGCPVIQDLKLKNKCDSDTALQDHNIVENASRNEQQELKVESVTSTPSNSSPKGNKMLKLLLEEAAEINGMNKKRTPRCMKCQRMFRSASLLAEHYQVHGIIRTRSGHLTLYGDNRRRRSSSSSGSDCIICTPPSCPKQKTLKRLSSRTPLSRNQSGNVRNQATLHKKSVISRYTPSTSTSDTDNNNGSMKRKLNFDMKKVNKYLKCSQQTSGETSTSSETVRILNLRKRKIEITQENKESDMKKTSPKIVEARKCSPKDVIKNKFATAERKNDVSLKSMSNAKAGTNKKIPTRRLNKLVVSKNSPLLKRLKKPVIRYTPKLTTLQCRPSKGNLKIRSEKPTLKYSPKSSIVRSKCSPKSSASLKYTPKSVVQRSKRLYKGKPVVSKIPLPISEKLKKTPRSIITSASKKSLCSKRLSVKYMSKHMTIRSDAKKSGSNIHTKCSHQKDLEIRQSCKKVVTIKHSGHKLMTNEQKIRPIEKRPLYSNLSDSDATIDYLSDDEDKFDTSCYKMRKVTLAKRVKPLSKQEIDQVLSKTRQNNNKDVNEMKSMDISVPRNDGHCNISPSKVKPKVKGKRGNNMTQRKNTPTSSSEKLTSDKPKLKCGKNVKKKCRKDISKKVSDHTYHKRTEDINNNSITVSETFAKDCTKEDINNNSVVVNENIAYRSGLMPAPNTSHVTLKEDELDFEAALLEMQLVNEGLPSFLIDNQYIENLKKKTKGKSLQLTGENDKKRPKKKTCVKGDKPKAKQKKLVSKPDEGTVVSASKSIVVNTGNYTNGSDVPPKFKITWKKGDNKKRGKSKENSEDSCQQVDIGSKQKKKGMDGESLDKCKYCDDFMPKCDLPAHRMALHRYPCNLCKQRFPTKEARTSHQKTHTVYHECQLCEKKFLQVHQFKRHLLSADHLKFEKIQKHTMDYMYNKFMEDKAKQTGQQQETSDVMVNPKPTNQNPVTQNQPITSDEAPAAKQPQDINDVPPLATEDFTFNDGFLKELGLSEPTFSGTQAGAKWEVPFPNKFHTFTYMDTFDDNEPLSTMHLPVETMQPIMSLQQDYENKQPFDVGSSGFGSTSEPSFNVYSGIRTALNLVDMFVDPENDLPDQKLLSLC